MTNRLVKRYQGGGKDPTQRAAAICSNVRQRAETTSHQKDPRNSGLFSTSSHFVPLRTYPTTKQLSVKRKLGDFSPPPPARNFSQAVVRFRSVLPSDRVYQEGSPLNSSLDSAGIRARSLNAQVGRSAGRCQKQRASIGGISNAAGSRPASVRRIQTRRESRNCHPVDNDVRVVKADRGRTKEMRHFALVETVLL